MLEAISLKPPLLLVVEDCHLYSSVPVWPLAAALAYIAVGPALLAYRAWGAGVSRAGPAVAGFFANLTPLFTALLSAAFLGEMPHLFHVMAFALIVGGILVTAPGSRSP